MPEVIIYHNNRCGKSRAALEILQEKGIAFTVRQYLTDPLTEKELTALLKKLGMQPSELVRTNEQVYKDLYKGKEISEQEWLSILAQNPILIERPIIEKGRKAIVARPPERTLELL